VSCRDHAPKFREPADTVGDGSVVRAAYFEHHDDPLAVKFAIEKLSGQLLRREPIDGHGHGDDAMPLLRYCGFSLAGGHPSTVRLELRAVKGPSKLYLLTNERSAPKRWEHEDLFVDECDRRFAHWCSRLRIVGALADWRDAPASALARTVQHSIAAEDTARAVADDPASVAALQNEIIDALRAGMGFFTAHKEGGSHLFFDGTAFRRTDYGDAVDRCEIYPTDTAMIDALRRFYGWDARRAAYPHPVSELQVWAYIRSRLSQRRT